MEGVDAFAETVYNYWKNRREELKFPLLRQLWRPSPDEYNHMLAFRPRERDKRSLRRTNRAAEDQIVEQLFQQFDLALKAVDRIQMREELKYKQVQLQLSGFYADCKGLIALPDFTEVKLDERPAEKERLRNFHEELDRYKSRRESIEIINVVDTGMPAIDQKQSVVNFLATIVYEAELLGINYQKIFYPTVKAIPQPIPSIPEPIPDPQPKPTDEEPLSVSLMRIEDKIIRSFSEDESETVHVKPCKDYL